MTLIQPITEYDRLRRSAGSQRRPLGKRSEAGRYDGRSDNTRLPPGGSLARMPLRSRNADVVVAAVEDPWGDGKQRVLASVNRRVDILEQERSHKRISEGAYRVGRVIQAAFERLGRVAGSNWSAETRIDRTMAKELLIERTIESTAKIVSLLDNIRARIGMRDARLLQRTLGDRKSFAECAAFEGKSGERYERYIAARVRDALEDLSDAWCAKGKVNPTPDDKHLAATENAETRQAASIEHGTTRARLRRELTATTEAVRRAATFKERSHLSREADDLARRLQRFGGEDG